MKKIISILLLFVMIINLFIITKSKEVVYEKNYINLDEIDADNSTGISTWSAVPLVTQQNLDDGYTGGEGCQHLVSLSRDTIDGNLIFLGTDVGGTFRSTDGGNSWIPCNKGLLTRGVCRVAIDPINKNHLVASCCSGSGSKNKYNSLFYSFDMGENWTRSKNATFPISGGTYIYNTIKIDANSYDENLGFCTDTYWSTPYERDSATGLTPEQAGIHYSTDGGKNFQKFNDENPLFDGIMLIENGKLLIANQLGIFKQSENMGAFSKISELVVQSFTKVNSTYYILTDDGIFTSLDLKSFAHIESTNFPNRSPRNLTVNPLDENQMVMVAKKSKIAYSERPYYSSDGGKTWTLADISSKKGVFYYYTYSNGDFTFSPTKNGEVISFLGGVVTKSTDGGKTYYSSNTGINNIMSGGKFNFNIYDSNIIYFGAQDFGGAMSLDNGKTWFPVYLSKDNDGRDIYGGYAADENTLFGVYTEQWGDSKKRRDERYVCFSHDQGKTVNITKTMLEEDKTAFEYIRIDSNIITSYESSYQSPNNRNILFCGNYRSTDNGYTWENMLLSSNETKCLQVNTHANSTLYGVYPGEGYVVFSNDDGLSWQKLNQTPLVGNAYHISDVAVDPKNGYVYASFDNKLYRMNIDGSNIVNLTNKMQKDNMGTRRIITVAVDPNHPEIVYCGGSGDYYQSTDGTRRSCDCGETWVTVTCSSSTATVVRDGLTYGFEPKCLRVNPQTGEVWDGSSCLGFSKLSPPYENSVSEKQENLTISFYLNYDNKVDILTTKINRKIDEYLPIRDGYTFDGWYEDKNFTKTFVFGVRTSKNISLYAKWTQNK